MTVTTEAILCEAKEWDNCFFWRQNHIGGIGCVQRDKPGQESDIIASFRLRHGDPTHNHMEQWEPEAVTPFVRAVVARQRGQIAPVW